MRTIHQKIYYTFNFQMLSDKTTIIEATKMLNMNDEEILADFSQTRNLKKISKKTYRHTIKVYTTHQQKTLQELLDEAEQEEEQGTRWKHRTLKKRLIEFRNHLHQEYLDNTAKNHFSRILSIYRHYEIEIHELPPISRNNIRLQTPINFKDLPDKDIIKQAAKITTPLMRALILLMSSSGCARREVMNMTIQDYLNATRQYHQTDDIYIAISRMKDRDDIIPMFHIKRQKTNKYYTTFCSPEANSEIINYLLTRKKDLVNDDPLFKMHEVYLNTHFKIINETMGLGKVGSFNRFRSHMLRKFHASQLYNDGVSLEIVDALQGRGKDSTRSSYFMEDPEKLREVYVKHLNAVTINLDVNNLDLKSPEYIRLETENMENLEKLESYESMFEKLDARLKKLEKEDVNYDDVEELF